MFDDEISIILIYNIIYNKLYWFSVDSNITLETRNIQPEDGH